MYNNVFKDLNFIAEKQKLLVKYSYCHCYKLIILR